MLDVERNDLSPVEPFALSAELPLTLPAPPPAAGQTGATATFSRNSAISVGRLLASTLVALILPAYLSHKLPVQTFSAWVLILQMSAYVGFLDFGIQTGIAKYVAEYNARGDSDGANRRASAGLAIMLVAALLGVVLTLALAWQVPRLFQNIPPALLPGVRISLTAVGVSLSFGLLCSVPSAIFLGLQRYGVPTLMAIFNKLLYTLVIVVAVLLHGGLAVMGASVAAVNVLTGLLQVFAWRRWAANVKLGLALLDGEVIRQMLAYCSVLAVWTVGMLCVSGLDVAIVGRYDFGQTAFYSIATLPTNFLIAILGAALGPLLPTASALSAERTPTAMGHLLARITRYSVTLLAATGLPLLVAGYSILRLWVGPVYAHNTIAYLRILVLANMIRNICLPYATMLVATERQRVAIAGATAEAVVNLGSSIYLAHRLGAIGVAYGTLLGSFVSVGMHFAVSMHYTASSLRISRGQLLLRSVARPALILLPSLLCLPLWWTRSTPTLSPLEWAGWALATILLCLFAGLHAEERARLLRWLKAKLRPAVNPRPNAAAAG